ncbi:MAG: hypothetical protein C4519_15840 [Desulfobacteraceae bacterium]|nr:MAG: hypothetical protein C4519_15840 [Desulfobacteraceae bacterium]
MGASFPEGLSSQGGSNAEQLFKEEGKLLHREIHHGEISRSYFGFCRHLAKNRSLWTLFRTAAYQKAPPAFIQ